MSFSDDIGREYISSTFWSTKWPWSKSQSRILVPIPNRKSKCKIPFMIKSKIEDKNHLNPFLSVKIERVNSGTPIILLSRFWRIIFQEFQEF